jgi:aminoglycoside phosphotransferase (APT) family kinase protein
VNDRSVERNALLLLWTTLRNNLQPDLSSALAKDRAKRSDAVLLRLIAGYDHLAEVRTAFAGQYAELLVEARTLAQGRGGAGTGPTANFPGLDDNPVFIGIPQSAGPLEELLMSLSRTKGDDAAGARFDSFLARVAGVEASLRDTYESAVANLKPVGTRAVQAVTVPALERYLNSHSQGSRDVRVKSVNDVPGGRSKRTILVELAISAHLPSALVLRMDTGRGVGTNVSDEFPLLDRVSRTGLPVPEPLWLETNVDVFGFPFIVFRRMPGETAGDLIEGAFKKVPETGRALARALAAVHAAGASIIENPAIRGSAVPHTEALLKHYHDWWTAKKPFPSIIIEAAFIWLRRNVGAGLGQATVVHADTAFHNLLLDEGGNACLLDWEFAHFGDGAEDLASCRPAVQKFMPWEEFLAEYYSRGGSPVTDFQLDYFEVWRPLRNAVLCGTVLHSLMHGEADDIDPVTIALSTFARLQADLAKTLGAIANAALKSGESVR